jgi:hypothetical protein
LILLLQKMKNKRNFTCCIVIPVYRLPLPEDELSSLTNTMLLLASYSIHLVCPQGLDPNLDLSLGHLLEDAVKAGRDVEVTYFSTSFFESVSTYNNLMLSPSFYQKFIAWDYILIAQLDAWIFSPDLACWLEYGYSYLGAPWLSLADLPLGLDCPKEAVGNGGLSLRRVVHHHAVLVSWRFRYSPVLGLREILSAHSPLQPCSEGVSMHSLLRFLNRMFLVLRRLVSWRNSLSYYAKCGLNEDILLGLLAPRVFPWFRVADPRVAARFSLDENPGFFFQRYLGSDSLPFGCHAWRKSYASFWQAVPSDLPSFGKPGSLR